MTVVSAFLIQGVQSFYKDEFISQMEAVLTGDMMSDLRGALDTEDPVETLQTVIGYNLGKLGVDFRTRHYYILDDTAGLGTARPPTRTRILKLLPIFSKRSTVSTR
jgi:two-component system sensor histidine kinase VicK